MPTDPQVDVVAYQKDEVLSPGHVGDLALQPFSLGEVIDPGNISRLMQGE